MGAAPVRTEALIGFVERIDALGQSVVVVYTARFRFQPGRFSEYCHIASRRPSNDPDLRDEQAHPVYDLHKEPPARSLRKLRPPDGDEARLLLTRKLHKVRRVQRRGKARYLGNGGPLYEHSQTENHFGVRG